MDLYGTFGDIGPPRNLLVRKTVGDEDAYLAFPRRQHVVQALGLVTALGLTAERWGNELGWKPSLSLRYVLKAIH